MYRPALIEEYSKDRRELGKSIVIEPSIEQVRAGKVPKPKKVYVTTTLMEFQAENESITIQTAWEIDYELRELRYFAGYFEALTLMEPLLPWRVPDRHVRAARKVAAAAFGMKRFRRPVRMYEPYKKEHLFVASYKKNKILLEHKEDAIIWGLKMKDHLQVEKLSVDKAAKLFNLSPQSAIETAQKMSMILKARLYVLAQRQLSYRGAELDFNEIMRDGYPESLWFQFSNFLNEMTFEMKRDQKLRT